MLVVLPFCNKDKALAIDLLKWIGELGPQTQHRLLMVHEPSVLTDGVREAGRAVFGKVLDLRTGADIDKWPQGPNSMWLAMAYEMSAKKEREPWFWMEPDCTPLAADFLDQIELGYKAANKPFYGDFVASFAQADGFQVPAHLSGVAVYPPDVGLHTDKLWQVQDAPWDVHLAPDILRQAFHSVIIQHEPWRGAPKDRVQPTFPDADSLRFLRPGAVLHHRCKDGSLIARLRESRGGQVASREPSSSPVAGSIPAPATPLETRVAELEGQVAMLGKRLSELLRPKGGGVVDVSEGRTAKADTNGHTPSLMPAGKVPHGRTRAGKQRETREQMLARMAALRAKKVAKQ
jgi:hypothetical protein